MWWLRELDGRDGEWLLGRESLLRDCGRSSVDCLRKVRAEPSDVLPSSTAASLGPIEPTRSSPREARGSGEPGIEPGTELGTDTDRENSRPGMGGLFRGLWLPFQLGIEGEV